MPSIFLKVDDHTSLHLPSLHDAEELYAIIDNERNHLKRWLLWAEGTTEVQDTRNFLTEAIKLNEGGQQLTTLIRRDGKIIGSVGFVRIDASDQVGEIGYWLRENLQGQGIMTNCCRVLIQYAFEHRNLNRIEIHMIQNNRKSQGVPERLKFTHEGTLRQARKHRGEFVDEHVYAMLKQDWMLLVAAS